ncbi:MAG: thermonuclease family protein [Actinomycetes bacterium]
MSSSQFFIVWRASARPAIATAATLFALAIVGGCGGDANSTSSDVSLAPGSARVTRVVDGDTIVVDLAGHNEKVRLLGIDTPETKSPTKPVQCFGKEAAHHTAELLAKGTIVRLERDIEERDAYGRLLAYVYRSSDSLFVNLELAQLGFASLLTYEPNVAHAGEFTAAVDAARSRGDGLWGQCGGPGQPAR